MTKDKRYLLTVTCDQVNPEAGRSPRGVISPDTLTHTAHRVVTASQLHADQLALDFAQEHGAAMVQRHARSTWDEAAKVWHPEPSTVGLSRVVAVTPVKRRKPKAGTFMRRDRSDKGAEAQAITYALWLATRDGIELPTHREKPRVSWAGVYSKTRTRRLPATAWCPDPKPQAIYERRICAVEWGHEEERFNTRKDGKRGAWTHNEFVPVLRIEIPHWDWQPDAPIEQSDEALAA